MKKVSILCTLLLLLAFPLHAQDAVSENEIIRGLMEAETVSISDAKSFLELYHSVTFDESSKQISKLSGEEDLTIGSLSVLMLETELVKSGLFYKVFGLKRYGAQALASEGITPEEYSFSRAVSGPELIEFAMAVADSE